MLQIYTLSETQRYTWRNTPEILLNSCLCFNTCTFLTVSVKNYTNLSRNLPNGLAKYMVGKPIIHFSKRSFCDKSRQRLYNCMSIKNHYGTSDLSSVNFFLKLILRLYVENLTLHQTSQLIIVKIITVYLFIDGIALSVLRHCSA